MQATNNKTRRDNIIRKQNAISNLSSMRAERRNAQAIQIRKSKRNQLLAVKRRLQQSHPNDVSIQGSNSLSTIPSSSKDLRSICVEYCNANNTANSVEKSRSASLLAAIQSCISRVDTDVQSINSLLLSQEKQPTNDIEQEIRSSLAMKLAQTLSNTLLHPDIFSQEEQMDASRVLTNLAASESPSSSSLTLSSSSQNLPNYYGRQTLEDIGWCGILIRSNALQALVHPISIFIQMLQPTMSSSSSTMTNAIKNLLQTNSFQPIALLCEQCCWAIGNLAGDSQEARNEATQKGIISVLIQCFQFSFYIRSVVSMNANTTLNNTIFGICRNAAWAISNMARGAETSALPFLEFLTPKSIADILLAPDVMSFSTMESSMPIIDVTGGGGGGLDQNIPLTITRVDWMEVACETCWILAFITAREHEAVSILCSASESGNKQDTSTSIVCKALAHCLSVVSKLILSIAEKKTNEHNSNQECAFRIFIPCIRAIGNIATACDGVYVPFLLSATSLDNQMIPQSIANILQFFNCHSGKGHRYEMDALIPEAAWAAGTLLCDLPNYARPQNSTLTISNLSLSQSVSQSLIPALCATLVSPRSKLDVKKEAASALWNAVAPSPPNLVTATVDYQSDDMSIKHHILLELVQIPNMFRVLVDLLTKPDADAVFLSLRLINVILRQINSAEVRTQFDEEHLLDALEKICDDASCEYYGQQRNSSDEEYLDPKVADIAADLIDDFFSDDYMERQEAGIHVESDQPILGNPFLQGKANPNNTFSFGLQNTGKFAFHSSSAQPSHVQHRASDGSFDPISGRGRGRGRGMSTPAWMQQR